MQNLLDKKKIGIVVLAYNRPSHLQRLLISLQNSGINKISLYLDKPNDEISQFNQKEIIRMIDAAQFWLKSEVKRNKKHLGVSKSIKFVLDKEFKKFSKIIFLEDDCVPFKFFFDFTLKCLEKFENNNEIMSVCGYQLPFFKKKEKVITNIFLKRFMPWGWATWKNRWKKYNGSFSDIKNEIFNSKEKIYIPKEIKKYLKNKRLLNNSEDVWSINWSLLHYLNNSFCVYPNISLIRNIGFDGSGIHCNFSNAFTVNNYDKSLEKVKINTNIFENKKLDIKIEKYLFKNFPSTIFKKKKWIKI